MMSAREAGASGVTVAHVHGTYVPSRIEGISANVHGLALALRATGLQVELRASPVELAGLNRRRALVEGTWRAARAAREAARRPGVRLVHVHVGLPVTALAARAALRRGGPPVVVQAWNAHADPRLPDCVPRGDRLMHRLFNGPEAAALGLRSLPEVVVASRHQARQLRALGFQGRVHRVPNGVDTARFRPAAPEEKAAARARFGLRGDGPVLLYYGHASSWKGLPVLLEALPAVLREHRRAQALLSLTAYGRDAALVRDEVRRLGLDGRVTITGPSEAPLLLAAADVAVLPAPANVGTACFPNVLLESMAAGVPAVATRAGCVPEAVQDGRTGLLARPADAADLARRLGELAGDEVLRRRLGAQARPVAVQRFAWPLVARRMLSVYAQVLPPESLPDPARLPAPGPAPLAAGQAGAP